LKQQKNHLENDENQHKKKQTDGVKIKYDIFTPEERDPQPKAYDEIEY
jgi:hypothetical protein